MATAFKKGDPVTVKGTTLAGVVETLAIVDDEVQFCVAYTDNDGEPQMRYFADAQLLAVAE